MNPILLALLLVFVLSAATVAGARGLVKRSRTMTAENMKSMSVREVSRLLEAVAKEEAPEFVMGAMCYAAMALPDVAEYVCPACGEKTVYSGFDQASRLWEIDTARYLVEGIRAIGTLDVSLDETSFCSFCAADSTEPALRLVITYEDGTTVTPEIGTEDLRMLAGLLSGNLYYQTSNDSQAPLLPNLDRLQDILGLGATTE